MTFLYLADPVGLALSLSVLMAGALRRDSPHIAVRTADITDSPRYAAFARGIPLIELRSRRERYRQYQSRASLFFPLPVQRGVVT